MGNFGGFREMAFTWENSTKKGRTWGAMQQPSTSTLMHFKTFICISTFDFELVCKLAGATDLNGE